MLTSLIDRLHAILEALIAIAVVVAIGLTGYTHPVELD
jgi:hypothetical protein